MDGERRLYERMTRIETVQESLDRHIQDLATTTKELTKVVSELANQRESLKRLQDRQDATTKRMDELGGELFKCTAANRTLKLDIDEINTKLLKYEEIEKSVTHNSFITKIIIGVTSAIFLTGLSVAATIIKNGMGV